MACIQIEHGFICMSPSYRLPLSDGRRVFMSWHSYCGPDFYYDRNEQRPIDEWWDDPQICKALDWFLGRGKRA